jgi:hypothetical protein
MIERSINGDDQINEMINNTMNSVVSTMVVEGVISERVAEKFMNDHVAVFMPYAGGFSGWLRRRGFIKGNAKGSNESIIAVMRTVDCDGIFDK